MAFKFNCPECGTAMIATEREVGRETHCASCLATFPVPEPPLFEEGNPRPDHDGRAEDERRSRPDEREDEPRPRRRRRRPPPPPPGRGPLFWVVIILGGLFLGGCACCGGGFALLPGENWHRHKSPEGGFAVDLPAPVKKDMPIPGMKPDPAMKVEGTTLWKRGEVYIVTYMEILPAGARAVTDEGLLDEITREMKADREITRIVRNERIKVSGFQACEIEYLFEDGGTYIGRFVIADRRMYAIVAGGRFVRPGNANVRRFLDSFEVTDPLLKGGLAFEVVQKDENAKIEAERQVAAVEQLRLAEEKQQKTEAAFEAAARYTGPAVPDPRVLPGLVAHLSFDEADPTLDRVSGQSVGTLRGHAGVGTGVRGKALTVLRPGAGIDLDALLPKLQFATDQSFTIAGWYRLDAARRQSGGTVFAADNPGDKTLAFYFRPDPNNPEADVRSKQQDDGAWSTVRPFKFADKPPQIDSNWHHFALVREYSRGRELVTLYLDGVWHAPVVKGFHTDLTGLQRAFLGDPPGTELPNPKQAWTPPPLLGAIDEFCVYDRALCGHEVRVLTGQEAHDPNRTRPASPADLPGTTFYLAFTEPAGGIGSEAFETISGKRIGDGNGRRATALGQGTAVESPRNEGNRLTATREDKWKPDPTLAISTGARQIGARADEPFTLVTWVRVEKEQTGACGLVHAAGASYLNIDVSAGKIEVALNDQPQPKGAMFGFTEPESVIRLKATNVPDGWYHLALTRNTDGTVKLFVNAAEVATTEKGAHRRAISGFYHLGLGWRKDKHNVAVSVDEFAAFNRELTTEELLSLAGLKALPKK